MYQVLVQKAGGNGQLLEPRNIVVDRKKNIYIVDSGNSRIQKFDSDGNFLLAFGKTGNGNGEFRKPRDIETDNQGKFYVTDRDNKRVQIYEYE